MNYTVRRLTPLECERLQGYPDGWTDLGEWTDDKGKTHKPADTPRYKALGNSIATVAHRWYLEKLIYHVKEEPTMASLFDGIGGFPMIWNSLHWWTGIPGETLWASEIEDFPIAVTRRRFPDMKHLGDVTGISGSDAPPVSVIIGGSPCQDLSVAGKRAGLAGARSGLFMEQIRIIKEMREATNGRYPRYMVWENVPGAFSSNRGKDFAAVLEETARVADQQAPTVPVPEKGWPTAGCLMGRGYSVAWRVCDAQFWGVPQRRRRISLVADFGGSTAPEILFERESLSGDPEPICEAGEASAGASENCAGKSGNDSLSLFWDGADTASTLTARNAGGGAENA